MATAPLRVGVRVGTINYTPPPQAPKAGGKTYLWAVFFKIDGDSASLNSNLMLEGTATVASGPGGHGNLGDNTDNPGQFISVPPEVGDFRTILRPIPLQSSPQTVVPAGVVGWLFILMVQNGSPDGAIIDGHNTLTTSLRNALDTLIPTLGMKNQTVSQDQIDAISQQIQDAVNNTIKNDTSFWDFLGAGFAHDVQVGNTVSTKSSSSLMDAPATGIPISASFSHTIPLVNLTYTWDLTAHIYADPIDFSIRRAMEFQNLNPALGVRLGLLSVPTSSVRNWIISKSATYFAPGTKPPPG